MSQAGNYPDCEICEYKIFNEDAQKKVESEPSTSKNNHSDEIASHLMAHSRDDGMGEVIINSGEFYQSIKQLRNSPKAESAERHSTFWKMRVKLADGWHERFVVAESDKEAFDHMDTAFTGGIEWEIIEHNPITIVEPKAESAESDNSQRDAIPLKTVEKVLRENAELLADMKHEDPIEQVMGDLYVIAEELQNTSESELCPECKGEGKLESEDQSEWVNATQYYKCPRCKGTGKQLQALK